MTEPSQYFKGRTVQEQMNEVIGYVDARAEEVAAAKADDVLEPAEQAKDDAIAAKEAAENARDTTLAALPQIQQDITDLKAEDVALDRRLDTVELKVQTAEGNIVTIQGQITALQTADGQNVKLGGLQTITGVKNVPLEATGTASNQIASSQKVKNELDAYTQMVRTTGSQNITGVKTFQGVPPVVSVDAPMNATSRKARGFVTVNDSTTSAELATIYYVNTGNGTAQVELRMFKLDGTYASVVLGTVTL